MDVLNKLRRMSVVQLRALEMLSRDSHGLAHSSGVGIKMGVVGKSLGGVFSSLSRQRIGDEPLVLPWGKGGEGRGLRWKLNDKIIDQKQLRSELKELLQYEK
jgi:hypothetical protein